MAGIHSNKESIREGFRQMIKGRKEINIIYLEKNE